MKTSIPFGRLFALSALCALSATAQMSHAGCEVISPDWTDLAHVSLPPPPSEYHQRRTGVYSAPSKKFVSRAKAERSYVLNEERDVQIGEPIARMTNANMTVKAEPGGDGGLHLAIATITTWGQKLTLGPRDLQTVLTIDINDNAFALFQYHLQAGTQSFLLVHESGEICTTTLAPYRTKLFSIRPSGNLTLQSADPPVVRLVETARVELPESLMLANIGTTVDVELRSTQANGSSILREKRSLDPFNSNPVLIGLFEFQILKVVGKVATIKVISDRGDK